MDLEAKEGGIVDDSDNLVDLIDLFDITPLNMNLGNGGEREATMLNDGLEIGNSPVILSRFFAEYSSLP